MARAAGTALHDARMAASEGRRRMNVAHAAARLHAECTVACTAEFPPVHSNPPLVAQLAGGDAGSGARRCDTCVMLKACRRCRLVMPM